MYRNTDCLTEAAECLPCNVSNSVLRVLKNDSAQALSRQFPFWLMLCRTEGQRSRKTLREDDRRFF
jgi:hypothetical protein